MNTCVFCKITSGDILTEKKEHGGGAFVSFLDKNPKAPGHTLLVPRKHYRWFLDMPEDEYIELMKVARTLSGALKEEYGADYIQIGIAGDEVPHVHVHLIPRKLKT